MPVLDPIQSHLKMETFSMRYKPLSAIPYCGGKNAKSNNRMGQWIANIIPYSNGYIEPFCGMAGVLLQRNPSKLEILNDRCDRIINWWRIVRDRREEFEYKIENTPISESEFHYQKTKLDSENEMERALATHIIITQSIRKLPQENAIFSRKFNTKVGKKPKIEIKKIANRMRNVQLFNMDAIKLLEKILGREDYSIYIDPPYDDHGKYYTHKYDKEKLSELLMFYSDNSKIAISGYGNDWNHLKWECLEKEVSSVIDRSSGKIRTEKLWINFNNEAW